MKYFWIRFAHLGCLLFCRVFFRMQVYGLDNVLKAGPAVLICNHQSFLDPLFCGIAVRRHLHFLARDTLFKNPVLGPLIRSVNTIPVRRGHADIKALKKIIGVLDAGKSVCLFPEGTRTSDGRIAPFKGGFGLLCRRSGACLVPVVVEGAFECWPRNRKFFLPGRIVVSYDRPIMAECIKSLTEERLAEIVAGRMKLMQNQCRVLLGDKPFDYGQGGVS